MWTVSNGWVVNTYAKLAVTLALFTNGTFNISLGLLRFIQRSAQHMGLVVWVDTTRLFFSRVACSNALYITSGTASFLP